MVHRISRRDFLRLATLSLLAGMSACQKLPAQTPSSPTKNIQKPTDTPAPVPSSTKIVCKLNESFYTRPLTLEGVRYKQIVPDSFDFQRQAELSLNALTRTTNPDADYSVYFYGRGNRNPPILTDADIEPTPASFNGKFSEATLMMRLITGSDFNKNVDQAWRTKFLRWLVQNRPVMHGPDLGRLLCWLGLLYKIEGDPCYLQLGQTAIYNIRNACISQDRYSYLPGEQGDITTGLDAVNHGWTLQGIAQFYLASGFDLAASIGSGIAYYLRDRSNLFDRDGNFLYRQQREWGAVRHFHSSGNALLAIAEMAGAIDDKELASFAREGYEHARKLGAPQVGFFPEYIPDHPGQLPYIDCETCCVADMIQLALNLTIAGQGDYWDDIDRYLRNQLVENQLKSGDWLEDLSANFPKSEVPAGATAENVSARIVGSFSGWAAPNDYLVDMNQPIVSACCTGNGSRAMYYIWNHMIHYDQSRLTVHLLLNRASEWADVISYIPYKGKVDVVFKKDCDLLLRLPEWVTPQECYGLVNNNPCELDFLGRYAIFSGLKHGDTATISFPIAEKIVHTTIGERPYQLTIRGNEVVEIDPPGTFYPYYRRSHFRQENAPLIEYNRYVMT